MLPDKLLIDVCSGRWGWSKAFAVRGWRCIGIDLAEPPEIPRGCEFIKADLRDLHFEKDKVQLGILTIRPDFLVASTPCEKFSVHGMAHFHPNPPYPAEGIELFEHVRAGFEATGIPYCMENVRAAQQFVGKAVHHCGPFYLWGTGVPALLPKGLQKKDNFHALPGNLREKILKNGLDLKEARNRYQQNPGHPRRHELVMTGGRIFGSATKSRAEATAAAATIPPELANCVAEYAERLLEQKRQEVAV